MRARTLAAASLATVTTFAGAVVLTTGAANPEDPFVVWVQPDPQPAPGPSTVLEIEPPPVDFPTTGAAIDPLRVPDAWCEGAELAEGVSREGRCRAWRVPRAACGAAVQLVAYSTDLRHSEVERSEAWYGCRCADLDGNGVVGGTDYGRWITGGMTGGGAWFGAWRTHLGRTCPELTPPP